MHLATTLVNGHPILCVVTDRGVAPVAEIDSTLPTDAAALQDEPARSALLSAVDAAPDSLFVPPETVELVDV